LLKTRPCYNPVAREGEARVGRDSRVLVWNISVRIGFLCVITNW
jgi:hypothetical protein